MKRVYPFIEGVSRNIYSPFDVTMDDFDIPFIARGLSRLGRYLGTGEHYLSVAEHSVELSKIVSPENAVCALLHDASECFVGDLHSHIKKLLRENNDETFDYLEQFFWELVAHKFDLDVEMPEEVHRMDKEIRDKERESLYNEGPHNCLALQPFAAEQYFLRRAEQLGLIEKGTD